MKTSFAKYLLMAVAGVILVCSCEDGVSYAELRKREKKQVQAFLQKGVHIEDEVSGRVVLDVPAPIKVISEEEFDAAGNVTDYDQNEYVLFSGSGVYMQILRKGPGQPIAEGEKATVISRYIEYNIATDTIKSLNNSLSNEPYPEVMLVTNTGGLFTASFVSGVMATLYQSNQVPSGWTFPFPYINIGRQDSEDSEIALVRLIVPSTEGQSDAYTNTYPCFYEISYQAAR